MTHNEQIERWLRPFGRSITSIQALNKFNCWSLRSRISDLKKKGIKIGSEYINDKKNHKRYKKYFIA